MTLGRARGCAARRTCTIPPMTTTETPTRRGRPYLTEDYASSQQNLHRKLMIVRYGIALLENARQGSTARILVRQKKNGFII
jgi:hypothetical protein